MTELVQVGSELYVRPADVQKVYRTEPFEVGGKACGGNVYVMSHDTYQTSDWPLERVRRALGLTDRTWIHDAWERA